MSDPNDPIKDLLRRFMSGETVESLAERYHMDRITVEGVIRLACQVTR